jgi:hypothetical protein
MIQMENLKLLTKTNQGLSTYQNVPINCRSCCVEYFQKIENTQAISLMYYSYFDYTTEIPSLIMPLNCQVAFCCDHKDQVEERLGNIIAGKPYFLEVLLEGSDEGGRGAHVKAVHAHRVLAAPIGRVQSDAATEKAERPTAATAPLLLRFIPGPPAQ